MGKVTCRAGLVIALGVATWFLFQGCNIKVNDEVVAGLPDSSLQGELEKGCVLKIERGKGLYPPEPDDVLFENPDGSHEQFSRYVNVSAKLEVGKCYQWKLGLGDPWSGKMPAVASDTVQEINP